MAVLAQRQSRSDANVLNRRLVPGNTGMTGGEAASVTRISSNVVPVVRLPLRFAVMLHNQLSISWHTCCCLASQRSVSFIACSPGHSWARWGQQRQDDPWGSTS